MSKILYIVLLFLLLESNTGWSQEVRKEKPKVEFRRTSIELLDVEIKPQNIRSTSVTSFQSKDVKNAVGVLRFYSKKEIKQSTAHFLIDFLNQIPSVSIISSFGIYRSVAIRGYPMEFGNLSVFLDGMPLTENFLGDINLGLRLPLNNIETIQVLFSPSPATNGSNVGVCSIWLTTSNKSVRQSINVSFQGGTAASKFSNGFFTFKNQRKYTTGVSYSISGHILAGDLSNKQTTDFYNNNINFKSILFTQSRKLNFNFNFKNLEISAVNESHDFNNNYIGDRLTTNLYNARAQYKKVLNSKANLFFSAGVNSNRFSNESRNPIGSIETFNNIDKENFFIINQIDNKEVVSFQTYIDGRLSYKLKDNLILNQKLQFRTSNSKINSIIDQDFKESTPNFIYNYAFEVDYQWKGFNILMNNLSEFSSVSQFKILPSLHLVKPIRNIILSASYMYYYIEPVGIKKFLLGNSLTIPSSEMGIVKVNQKVNEKISFNINGFYNKQSSLNVENSNLNKLERNELPQIFRETIGGETELNYTSNKLNITLGYSYYMNQKIEMERSEQELVDSNLSPGIPNHKFVANLSYQFRSKFLFSCNYIFESNRLNSINFKNDGLVLFALPQYQELNLKLSAKKFLYRLINMSFSVENLLNRNNYITSGLLNDPFITPRQGMNISVSFSMDINNK